jgi:quinol-cytochrome oxidoreductase complex cytochrome b subunit
MHHVSEKEGSRGPLLRGLKEIFQEDLHRTVPARITSLHYLGALAFIFVCLQIVTGILLMVYYRPAADEAYASMVMITDEVRLGWLVQGLHRWGADLLVLLALLHLVRVYLARAYPAPRQFNWVVGVLLLLCLFAFAFTGNLLPWDQYAYWSTTFARAIIANIPVLGNVLLELLWGGGEAGEEALLRFYVFHVGILPWMTVLFLFVHLFMVWRLGIKQPSSGGTTPLFPDFLVNLFITALLLFGLLLLGAVLVPSLLLGQADPMSPLDGVKPRWYFLPLHELLQHFTGGRVALIVTAFFLLLFLVPFLDRRPDVRVWRRVLLWILGWVAVAGWFLVGLRGYLL